MAVTVTDWSRNDCWIGTATIWWSKSKSEPVPAFSVCWGQSVGYAVNNAANLHLFMQQTAVEHSGNALPHRRQLDPGLVEVATEPRHLP